MTVCCGDVVCVSLFEPASLWIIDDCKRPQHPGVVDTQTQLTQNLFARVHIHYFWKLTQTQFNMLHLELIMCVLILLFGVSSSVDKKADTVDGVWTICLTVDGVWLLESLDLWMEKIGMEKKSERREKKTCMKSTENNAFHTSNPPGTTTTHTTTNTPFLPFPRTTSQHNNGSNAKIIIHNKKISKSTSLRCCVGFSFLFVKCGVEKHRLFFLLF